MPRKKKKKKPGLPKEQRVSDEGLEQSGGLASPVANEAERNELSVSTNRVTKLTCPDSQNRSDLVTWRLCGAGERRGGVCASSVVDVAGWDENLLCTNRVTKLTCIGTLNRCNVTIRRAHGAAEERQQHRAKMGDLPSGECVSLAVDCADAEEYLVSQIRVTKRAFTSDQKRSQLTAWGDYYIAGQQCCCGSMRSGGCASPVASCADCEGKYVNQFRVTFQVFTLSRPRSKLAAWRVLGAELYRHSCSLTGVRGGKVWFDLGADEFSARTG